MRHGNSCAVHFQGKSKEADFDEMSKHARRENAVTINDNPPVLKCWPSYEGDRTDVRALHDWGMKRAGNPEKRRARGNWVEISEDDIPSNSKVYKARWNGKRLKFKHTAEDGMIRLNESSGKYEKYEELPVERADMVHCLYSVSPELLRDKDGNNLIGTKEEGLLINAANKMTSEIFGKDGLLCARYDRDEEGIGVVDVFALPLHERKRGSKTEVELNQFAAIEAWRKKKGFEPPINKKTGKAIVYGSKPYARWLGTLLQDEWYKRCKVIFPSIERGLSKDITKRNNLPVREYKELQDRLRHDENLKNTLTEKIKNDLVLNNLKLRRRNYEERLKAHVNNLGQKGKAYAKKIAELREEMEDLELYNRAQQELGDRLRGRNQSPEFLKQAEEEQKANRKRFMAERRAQRARDDGPSGPSF